MSSDRRLPHNAGEDPANLFYRNGRLWGLAVGFVLVAGFAALQTLGRQEDPTMTERYANLDTFLPGATAERVESLVTERLETALREIPEIKTIGSRSRAGYSNLDIELEDSVTAANSDVIWSEVRDKLGEVEPLLPAGSTRPDLVVRGPLAVTLAAAFVWEGAGEPQMRLLTRLAEDLQVRLANLPGTKETKLHGEVEEEIRVEVDPRALAAVGLTANDVAARVTASDTKIAAGRLQGVAENLLVEVGGELDSVERIAAIPLRQQGDGRFVRVSDVASVTRTAVDPPQRLALAEGRRAVVVGTIMEPGGRIDLWVDRGLEEIDAYRAELPPGIGLEVIFDQDEHTGQRLADLTGNLATALAIVMFVLVFFMGVRSAITVGLALPLTIAMVLSGLKFLDIPLHQMSVTGLIISLGLLIDNAIVIVEEYKLMRRRGREIPAAISEAVRHLLVPLAASTATTVFAFMPIAMTPGGTGEFTGSIAISVVLSVTSSFLLAMTIVPAATGFIEKRFPLRPREAETDAPWWVAGYSNASLTRAYRRSLDFVLARPWRGVAIGLVLPLLGFGLAGTLTQQFFPPVDRNQFQIQLSLPSQTSIAETRREVERLRGILAEYDEIRSEHFFLGEGGPRVYYNVMVNNDGVASFAAAFLSTDSPEATAAILPGLQARLIAEFPAARVMALPFEQGPPFSAPIELRVSGPDLATLRALGEEIRLVLAATEGVTYTTAALASGEPKVVVYPDENLSMRSGLAMADVPAQLAASLTGMPAGAVMEGIQEIPVRVRYPDEARATFDDLAALPLAGASARSSSGYGGVPLEQLARLELEPAASAVEHYQGRRINTISGFLMPYVLPAAALSAFEQRLADSGIVLPPGYAIEYGGEAEQRGESVGNLVSTFVMFLLLMVAVVVLSLNSWSHAGIIGLVGFLSVGLALFGVRLFGWPMGFTALIGTLGLVGLAINGAIIVLSALKADALAQQADQEASREVVVEATRHIVSTTVTTIGGFIPLILFGGTFWPPLATAIAGGVAGSAILALYMVPAIFISQQRRAIARARRADEIPMPERQRISLPGLRAG
ncbi:MAG: efflux RND transporter permease subunit [Pseudomonadales bacterium]|jgi:multidrug efflux pump subunit AcrB|nr:efflux RND transporter permease subunit [Pseudomonadales bacterium]